jgi:hypothetical protein
MRLYVGVTDNAEVVADQLAGRRENSIVRPTSVLVYDCCIESN